jgi:parallel beta-helix repeat protein
MINAVGVYGGFLGGMDGETERYERNWFDNETVLSGVLDSFDDEPNCVDYVVVSDANAVNALDGFTIQNGSIAGIYCGRLSPLIIQHNKITDNTVGIYCDRTKQPVIKNNWIFRNAYGMHFESPTDVAVVRNNTVANNDQMGIYLANGIEPEISNCIFSGNPEDSDLVGCYATYSYIEYPIVLDPNGTWPIGKGNIDGDPNYPPFVIGDDNYHLDPCSACIDAGDPCSNYWGERDIDKQFRVLDGDGVNGKRVDMGADEYCNETSDNDADFNDAGNGDGVVNYVDFAIFSKAWLSENDPCDDNWNPVCDISEITDNVIDANDLIVFAEEWLWMSCDGMKGIGMMEMMMGMGEGMGRMMGMESVLMAEQQAESQESYSEPSIEEQIEQIKQNIAVLYEVKDQVEDKDACLGIVNSLEEMLKELEDSQ